MRLMVDCRRRMAEAARARGEPVAGIGPALGFREMKWHKPVYVDDSIEYASEVIELRPSGSRPDRGLMSVHATGVNQNGVLVFSFLSTTFVERRPGEP
jgi:acyl dehydratase